MIMKTNRELTDDMFDQLREMNIPGQLLFAKVAGSHSHNTALPTSDMDISGIYLAKTEAVLGMDRVKETIGGGDTTIHEAGKFCRLLLKGNPAIIEMLCTEKMCYVTLPFQHLINERKRFLSKQVLKQYLGYMNAQMTRLEKGKPIHGLHGKFNEKFAYHFLRLGKDAVEVANGNFPVIWKEGAERDFLLDVRHGKYSQAQTISIAKQYITKVEELKPWPLPDEGDREFLNKWLIELRR